MGDANATSLPANASGENVSTVASAVAEANLPALEGVGNISPRLHAAQVRSRDPVPNAELCRDNKKLRIVCEFHAKGWCIRGSSCRFLHSKDGPDAVMKKGEALDREATFPSTCISPLQSGENPKLNSEKDKLFFSKDDAYLSDSTREDIGNFKQNIYMDKYQYYASAPVKENLNAWDDAYNGSTSITSHVKSDNTLGDMPDSYSRYASPFCSSSRNTSAHGPYRFVQSSLEHHAYTSSSMRRNISLAPRSESDTLSRNRAFMETDPTNYEATISSFDWEPSAPFRPSHEITQSILLKENLYNPVSDSTDKKDLKHIQEKFSNSDQGSSIKNVIVQSNNPKEEEKVCNSVLVGAPVKDTMLSSRYDDKEKHEKAMDGTIFEVDGSGSKDDIGADLKQDVHVQNESKAFKYFRCALIDFVKELVKPYWRDGLVSKDAHKLIVKKASDKVLSTLPTHQIPTSVESVKLYLSSCQPKLAKLVEGYINLYAKLEIRE